MIRPARAIAMAHPRWRFALAAMMATGLTGCAASVETAPDSHATVTVNDVAVHYDALRCSRAQSYLTVGVDRGPSRWTTVLDVSGASPVAKWTKIRDVAGFTGDVWQGGVGSAEVVRRADDYVVTGSAYGVYESRPAALGVSAPFRIEAKC
ncbi:lipoprotein LpqH [Mycobacterium sp. WMMD1722]|uniref:lipoprotein LpqH n=1 Tax=Mycobacterium sp. WMMD1722 TaxID=3404117 RepID=UPI003BF591A4